MSRNTSDEEDALAVLATMGRSIKDLAWHDRAMVRGRALARLRDRHRDEYERLVGVEAAKLLASGLQRRITV